MPLGLWFPAALLREMESLGDAARGEVRDLLASQGLSTFTFNAFPFGDFHDKVVKTKVYSPDWTSPPRLAYTLACARLLAYLLPEGAEGSLSTLPLGWRIGWSEDHSRRSAESICAFVREAMAWADEGKLIRLGLEPEPGCALETTPQTVTFWNNHLRPAAKALGLKPETLAAHVGICYDTCHQAVQFEDPVEALDSLACHGIPIAKMQLSSALEFLPDPARSSLELREAFAEPRFLHQTRIFSPVLPEGLLAYDDLPEALATAPAAAWAHPWRVHFHVPIDAAGLLDDGRIATTRGDMLRAYRHARERGLCRHFEVETYSWSVMPEAHRPLTDEALAECIARELRSIKDLGI